MKRRTFLHASLGAGLLGPLQNALPLSADHPRGAGAHTEAVRDLFWASRPLLGFGTTLSLQLAHRDKTYAEHALDLAVAAIRHLESQMNLFNAASALSQLNQQGFLAHPDPVLLDILQKANAISKRSQGAFDVTVQPLWAAFSAAQAAGHLPSHHTVMQARRHVGWQGLDIGEQHIRFTRAHMAVTLNGIAQGYAADLITARWRAMGIEHALINTGEWAALGRSPDQTDWHLGIANPRDEKQLLRHIALKGQSVATSSDAQTCFSPDLKHHHIFDPHTGYSPSDMASVTVLADSCTTADALTKVMFVAGMHKALALAKDWSVEVLLVDKVGRWKASAGLQA